MLSSPRHLISSSPVRLPVCSYLPCIFRFRRPCLSHQLRQIACTLTLHILPTPMVLLSHSHLESMVISSTLFPSPLGLRSPISRQSDTIYPRAYSHQVLSRQRPIPRFPSPFRRRQSVVRTHFTGLGFTGGMYPAPFLSRTFLYFSGTLHLTTHRFLCHGAARRAC